jgi:hypothetical protein
MAKMLSKKKICAGCGIESYIYKNIEGKKYCKSCTFKLQPPKAINKVSEKQKFKIVAKKKELTEDKEFYLKVWENRFGIIISLDGDTNFIDFSKIRRNPRCECCGSRLAYSPSLVNFHHILEKRNYPLFRHAQWNIAIVCEDCHSSYESNPNNVPYLALKKRRIIELFKY